MTPKTITTRMYCVCVRLVIVVITRLWGFETKLFARINYNSIICIRFFFLLNCKFK